MSVYFEYKNDCIELHKTYYIYDQLISSFSPQENTSYSESKKYDISDSVTILTPNDLISLIESFDFVRFYSLINNSSNGNSTSNHSNSIRELKKNNTQLHRAINEFKENIEENYHEGEIAGYAEKLINKLNKVFYGYILKDKGTSFVKDISLIENVNRCYQLIFKSDSDRIKNNEKAIPEVYQGDDLDLALQVYKVGQANCSALINRHGSDYDVVCVFDLGCSKTNARNKKLINMVNKIDENTTIIISHFDSDHFNYFPQVDHTKPKRWIFAKTPPEEIKTFAVFQLLLAVVANGAGSIYRYRFPFALSDYLTIDQKSDSKKDTYNSTVKNANSIVSIINHNKKVLIPADALYLDFRKAVTSSAKYDYVLIPHHGCFYPENSLPIKDLLKNETIGIVCSGNNNYHHASISHLSNYPIVWCFDTTVFYDVFHTRINFSAAIVHKTPYIEIDL